MNAPAPSRGASKERWTFLRSIAPARDNALGVRADDHPEYSKEGGAATPETRRNQALSLDHLVFTTNQGRTFRDARREVNPLLKLFAFAQAYAAELRTREEGQTMAEYGVVLAVITIAVIGAITLLSSNVRNAITSVANLLPGG
jgi:Flp pilus assembly pilin Flp